MHPIFSIKKSLQFKKIETTIDEELPKEYKDLFTSTRFEQKYQKLVKSYKFLTLNECLQELKMFVNTTNNSVHQKIISKECADELVTIMLRLTPDKEWERLSFQASKNSLGGAVIWNTDKDNTIKSTPIKKNYDQQYVFESLLPKTFAECVPEVEFTILPTGSYTTTMQENTKINTNSTPDDSIKNIYFHYKWVPVFSDLSGNFIGIDLDPGIRGNKGQVISYGRDINNKRVLATGLTNFLKQLEEGKINFE